MKKLKYFRLILCIVMFGSWSAFANAVPVINIMSSDNNPTLGQTFDVNFKISGLSSAAEDSLGGFDINVLFDNSVFSFSVFSFIDSLLGNNQLEFLEIGSFLFSGSPMDLGSGIIDAYGVTGNSSNILDTNQVNQFVFLSLSFTVLAPTSSTSIGIDLSDPSLLFLNSSFNDLPIDFQASNTNISISTEKTNSPVPEPNTLWLLVTAGLLSLVKFRNAMSFYRSA